MQISFKVDNHIVEINDAGKVSAISLGRSDHKEVNTSESMRYVISRLDILIAQGRAAESLRPILAAEAASMELQEKAVIERQAAAK